MEQEERELEASLREQIEQRNFTAAASMAERIEEPAERIKELQEAAIKQYITEYRNAQGVMALAQQYQFTDDEIDRLLEAIIGEVKASGEQKPPWAGKRYDIKTMKYLDVEEWIAYYGRELKRAGAR
ncbi:MAG: hypothetical protein JSW70_02140 [Syntrophobacterales bacterium]|nr:MAG: hypothetical protein JSW70_02140 [Syntrophobacterales bacterium]